MLDLALHPTLVISNLDQADAFKDKELLQPPLLVAGLKVDLAATASSFDESSDDSDSGSSSDEDGPRDSPHVLVIPDGFKKVQLGIYTLVHAIPTSPRLLASGVSDVFDNVQKFLAAISALWWLIREVWTLHPRTVYLLAAVEASKAVLGSVELHARSSAVSAVCIIRVFHRFTFLITHTDQHHAKWGYRRSPCFASFSYSGHAGNVCLSWRHMV
jgi:hypothetical protein